MLGRAIKRNVRAAAGWLLCVLGVLVLTACGGSNAVPRTGPLRVVVSIAPLKGLAEELTKDLGANAGVDLLVPIGAMEHGYEIPPSMISKLVQADVVVYIGLGLEPQVQKILREKPMKGRREVCFADVAGVKDDGHDHDHDHAHEDHDHGHDHSGVDPHLWLDPSLVAKLIPAMGAAIAGAARERGFTEGAAKIDIVGEGTVARLTARAGEVDARYEERLRPFGGATFITAHAAWGRLAERYGLVQAALAGLEANEPSPAAIANAAELIREKKAAAIFSEPQVNAAAVTRVAGLTGAKVLKLDPLGDGDWFKMMDKNLDALIEGLSAK